MQLTVKKAAIESAAKNLSRVISTNNSLPILGCILCEVADKRLNMTASDGEIDITTSVELDEMEGDGRFCVDAGRLVDALAQLPEQPITIIATTEIYNLFTIRHSSGESFFALQSADEYPVIGGREFKEATKIQGQLLRDALKRCLWSTGVEELRPVLNGVFFKTTDMDDLDIVASDGHALVVSTLISHGFDADVSAVVPKKAAKIIADLAPVEDYVSLRFNDGNGRAELTDYIITFRLIDGIYPNYRSVILKDADKEAVIDRRAMNECMKSVLPFSPDSSKLVSMTFKTGNLTMQGEDPGFEACANNSIDCDYGYEELTIGVKGTTVLNILKAMTTKTGNIVMKMKDASTAILFEPEEQEDEVDVTMLSMPMVTA